MQMEILTQENTYRSPKRKISFLARLAPSLVFYAKMIAIVLWSARLAKKGRYHGAEWTRANLGNLEALESVGIRFTVENLHIIQNLDSPAVYVGNHMSSLETFVLAGMIRPYQRVTYIIKESLVSYPIFKHVMKSRDPILVTRVNPREDLKTVLSEGVIRLKDGISVIVFPQTTRFVSKDLTRFNTIGIKLALRGGVPVVPFAVRTDAWGNGKRIKDFGKIDPSKPVHICFGDPIFPTGNGRKEHEAVVEFIAGKLNEWFPET